MKKNIWSFFHIGLFLSLFFSVYAGDSLSDSSDFELFLEESRGLDNSDTYDFFLGQKEKETLFAQAALNGSREFFSAISEFLIKKDILNYMKAFHVLKYAVKNEKNDFKFFLELYDMVYKTRSVKRLEKYKKYAFEKGKNAIYLKFSDLLFKMKKSEPLSCYETVWLKKENYDDLELLERIKEEIEEGNRGCLHDAANNADMSFFEYLLLLEDPRTLKKIDKFSQQDRAIRSLREEGFWGIKTLGGKKMKKPLEKRGLSPQDSSIKELVEKTQNQENIDIIEKSFGFCVLEEISRLFDRSNKKGSLRKLLEEEDVFLSVVQNKYDNVSFVKKFLEAFEIEIDRRNRQKYLKAAQKVGNQKIIEYLSFTFFRTSRGKRKLPR